MTDDVVAELDAWLNGQRGFSINLVIQRARDEIVALREMREAHIRMLSANNREARERALKEAARIADRWHADVADAIRELKEKGDD